MQQRNDQQFISVTDKNARNRYVTVIGGLPFYQSTGQNSREANTWFPFMGLNEVEIKRFVPLGAFITPTTTIATVRDCFPEKLAAYLTQEQAKLGNLITRFGNYEALCLSMLIGRGFWLSEDGEALKKFINENYKEDISTLSERHKDTIDQIQNCVDKQDQFSAGSETTEINKWLIEQGSLADKQKDFFINFQYQDLRIKPHVKNKLIDSAVKNTPAQDSVFTKISDFFSTPTLERDIIIGTTMGLLTAGALAGAIIFSVGTAGIGPLVFGATAAATLGAVGTGLSLGAIGLGIVGFFTAVFAGAGEYFRANPIEDQAQKTVIIRDQFAGLRTTENLNNQKPPEKSPTEVVKVEPTVKQDNQKPAATGIVGLSQELLTKLEIHKREMDVPLAMDYIKLIIFEDEKKDDEKKIDVITSKLKRLASIIKNWPDSSDIKILINNYVEAIQNNYVEAIQTEIKPVSSQYMS